MLLPLQLACKFNANFQPAELSGTALAINSIPAHPKRLQAMQHPIKKTAMQIVLATLICFGILGQLNAQVAPTLTPQSQEVRRLIMLKDLDGAQTKAQAQVDANPNSAQAHYWLGAVYGQQAIAAGIFSKMGFAKKVKRAFEKAAALDPKHIESRFGLLQFHLQAPGIAGGDEDVAKMMAVELAAIDPVSGHRARATLKFNDDDESGGMNELYGALKINPAHAETLAQVLGYLDSKKRAAEAEPYVKAGLSAAPNDPKIHYQAVKLAAITGRSAPEALVLADSILSIKPTPEGVNLPGAHFRRAQLLAALNRKQEALQAAQIAAKLAPDSEIITDYLATLQ